MTTDEIILALFGLAVAIVGPLWARWSHRRFVRHHQHHPAE